MLGGAAQRFPSDTRKIGRFVSLCAKGQPRQEVEPTQPPRLAKRGAEGISVPAPSDRRATSFRHPEADGSPESRLSGRDAIGQDRIVALRR